MKKLKRKIRIVNSLPEKNKKKRSIISIIIYIIIFFIISLGIYIGYNELIPYLLKTNINKITGKKTTITDCNTKDYIIINKDKSFTMSLTNINTCEQKYYNGDIIIKSNKIIFNKNITGIIDNNYNIIINNNVFESEKNE